MSSGSTQGGSTRRLGNLLIVVGALLVVVVVAVLIVNRPATQPESTVMATPSPGDGQVMPEAGGEKPPTQLPSPGATALATAQVPTPTPTGSADAPADSGVPERETATPPPLRGEPDRIVIPKIGLDAPIVDVGWKVIERGGQRFTEWETAENAAGRHINSARPGERGNVVLSGHHNTKGEVFRRISDLELVVGDAVYLYDGTGQRFTYIVDEVTDPPLLEVGATSEERLANARFIQPTSDARVTLVTCWPYWTNTHRVVVMGKMVE